MQPSGPSLAGDYVPLATLNTATYDDTEETQNEWPKPAEQKTRNAWERIGTLSILILLLGSGLIWRESMTAISGVPNIFWTRIVHANWTSRLVTVCTAVIRAIVTLQASLITAMVSSIILEGIGTPLFYAPFYSIIRVVSGILAQPKRLSSLFISMLVIIEVLVTVASHSFINSNNLTEAAWWRVPPASSWTFGELAESFSQGPNFHDTGHTYRAFIPFQDEAQRTSLRMVCVSPSFVDLRLNSTFPPRLFGQMTLGNESYPILQNMKTQGPINFTCALPFPSKNTTYGMSSLCYPLLALTSNIQLEDPLVNINPDDRIPLYSGYNNPLASPMLIVLDILDGVAMMARNLENITTPYRVTTLHKDGPWSIIMNGSNTAALRTFTVDMASSWQNWEPRLSWDRKSNSFDTDLNHRDFDMRINAIENDFNEFDTYFHFTTTFLNLLPTPQQALTPPDFPRANQGIPLSEANTADTSTADRSYTDIFKDVLHDTNSPALALQALITRGTQAAYYENLMREDPIASALTAFSSTALIPARWDGFVAGVSIIAVHLIILALITVLFVVYTRNSMVGNSWQAVAQVVSEDMLPVLDQACMKKDGEVKKRWGKDQLAYHSALRYWPNGRVAIGVEAKESPE
ncbi:hypothetical protein BDV24DRAFT_177201 [Aspergillus arachidicola]|uniref:Uncharacterized protein n=1 Tax=Aspergillus arachidicola TaxID=656916 RepID=A0A5N6XXG1_9EURO|nr:hypothetical protein BDV24DRAFT_177201 [Aspergillus arachidicola]